jgi:glycosyltransferase involved in cell wall biosynthesis
MKILVIAGGPFPMGRGTPARTLRASEALAARGHDVCVAALPVSDPSIETQLRVERSEGFRGYRKTSPGPSFVKLFVMDPRLAKKVRTLLSNEKFDVIYAHHYEGLIIASIAGRRLSLRIPVVFDAHTLLGAELSHYFPALIRAPISWFGSFLDGHLFRLADAIISVSDEITHFYSLRSRPDLPAVTAANGVELEKFDSESGARSTAETIAVVFAGNLSGYQGFDFLLAAFRRIRRQRQDIRLIVASADAGSVLSALGVEQPESEGISVRSGEFTDLPEILADADIAANPRTVCPGIPQKLLNYMASALPTVSFEGSSAILVNEETGLIVSNGDIEGFAKAIIRLADSSSLRIRLGGAARRLVATQYTWERVAETFERVYDRLS